MNTTKLDFKEANTKRAAYHRRQIKLRFASRRAEIIAWILFFGIGVSYFVASLIIATV